MADPENTHTDSLPAPPPAQPGAVPKASTGNKQLQVAPGYKIIKVRMPDGTIAKVRRRIDPAPASTDSKPADASAAAAEKEANVISSAPKADNAPKNGAAKVLSEKSPATTSVQPVKPAKPAAASAKSSTPVKPPPSTPSKTKSKPDTKTAVTTASWTKPQSRSNQILSAFCFRATVGLFGDAEDGLTEELGDFHDGDEVIYDNHDDSDGVDEPYDNHGDNDNNDDPDDHDGHGDSSSIDQPQHDHHLGNDLTSAGVHGLAAGMVVQPPAYKGKGGKKPPKVKEKEVHGKDAAAEKSDADEAPMKLESAFMDWTKYIIWAIMIVFPLLYIALAVLTHYLTTKLPGSKYTSGVMDAIKIAVSAWPILFAAVAAQTLRSIANYKVERGIRVMHLEQLMGSNSVASSIKQPLLLRKFNLVSIALLLLWSLSPLATQALQRMTYPAQHLGALNKTIYYLNTWTNNTVFSQKNESQKNTVNHGNIIQEFTLSALLPPAPLQELYEDQYSFPKIPLIHLLDADKNDMFDSGYNPYETEDDNPPLTDENGIYSYIDIDQRDRNFTYAADAKNFSSNYGIPLQLPNIGYGESLEFILKSSYLNFTCSNFTEVWGSTIDLQADLVASDDGKRNTTYMRMVPLPKDGAGDGTLYYYRWLRKQYTELLTFDNDIYAYSECNFTQIFVDSHVSCVGNGLELGQSDNSKYPNATDCIVEGIRQTIPPPSRTTMGNFVGAFLETVSSEIDAYLVDPTNITTDSSIGTTIMSLTEYDFTIRLGLLFNTYWQLGFGPTVQDGGLRPETAHLYGYYTNSANILFFTVGSVNGVDEVWVAILIACSVIVLLAAVANILLELNTIVPDMLGFAASLARKNRYADLPATSTAMSGPARARALADRRVMLQDVEPLLPVGKVELGLAREDASRLKATRLYV